MCGIAGVLDRDEARAAVTVGWLNERQRHRGPDHNALVRVGHFTLGNTRLAIQEPTPAGNQPFTSRDGRHVCVFNGEIYNFVELIERFRLDVPNHCDGSVIPELWAALGAKCLLHLRGMYAIAIVDLRTGTLSLARDPFGIKPLYVRRLKSASLAFASEVRPLAQLSPRAAVSREAVARYLHLGALAADASPFEGVEAIAPNSVMTVRPDGASSTRPILAGDHPLVGSADGPADDLGAVFRESIKLHLRADVPTVLLLSSGVDSAAIASAVSSSGQQLHCMTVRGVGSTDESDDAARSARRYGHPHEVVHPRLDSASLDRFFAAMQRPSIDGLNTFLVSGAVRQGGYRVALSGLGGDEALGGYRHYRLLRWLGVLQLADRVPQVGTALARTASRAGRFGGSSDKLVRLVQPGGPRTSQGLDLLQREVHPPERVHALTGINPAPLLPDGEDGQSRSFTSLVEAELRNYMQGMLLADADAFSMCWSVELRVPFVDKVFFRAAAAALSGSRRPGKDVLMRALDDPYLLQVGRRPKRGFSVPMEPWLRDGPLRPLADALHDPSAPVWEMVSRSEAERMVRVRPARWSEQWSFVALNRWLLSVACKNASPSPD